MKLTIYKTQTEIKKVVETKGYDLMFGTVEDILSVLDDVGDLADDMQLLDAIRKNRSKLNALLMDVFPELTEEDLRGIKVKELIPFFIELFAYVKESFGDKEKN